MFEFKFLLEKKKIKCLLFCGIDNSEPLGGNKRFQTRQGSQITQTERSVVTQRWPGTVQLKSKLYSDSPIKAAFWQV